MIIEHLLIDMRISLFKILQKSKLSCKAFDHCYTDIISLSKNKIARWLFTVLSPVYTVKISVITMEIEHRNIARCSNL